MLKWKLVNTEFDGFFKFECPFCGSLVAGETKNKNDMPDFCPVCKSNMKYKRNYSEDIVTLRKFLGIVGEDFILAPYTCEVILILPDPFFEEIDERVKFDNSDTLPRLNMLEPFMNYEIVKFHEKREYDEVVGQTLWLREIREEN